MQKLDRIVYLDFLKLISIIGVIIIHVTSIGYLESDINSTYIISVAYNSLFRWSVPIFFMVSGCLFLRKNKEINFSIMLKKYIPKLIIALVIFGAIYSLLDMYIYNSFSIKGLIMIVWNVFSNNTGYHLWFLYALISIYLMIPVFRLIVSNLTQKQLLFVILVWMILSLLPNQFNSLMSSMNLNLGFDWYCSILCSWGGYVLLGYYLNEYGFKTGIERLIVIFGLCSLLVCAGLNIFFTLNKDAVFDAFTLPNGLTTCFAATSIFLLFKNLKIPQNVNRCISKVGQDVYGIYLIHVLINSLIFKIFNFNLDFIPVIISIPIFTVIEFIISIIIVKVITLIKPIRKILK